MTFKPLTAFSLLRKDLGLVRLSGITLSTEDHFAWMDSIRRGGGRTPNLARESFYGLAQQLHPPLGYLKEGSNQQIISTGSYHRADWYALLCGDLDM